MAHSQPNLILSRLTDRDFRLIEADLEDVDLPVRRVLEQPQRRIDSVYFPESGFASVVANGAGKDPIEVGIIGREGMTGLSVLLGNERPKHQTYMQAPGKGRRLKTSILRKAIDQRTTLHRSLLRYVNYFLDQAAMTALANGRSTIEARLARWLLMADDRVEGGKLPLTHEFLAMMLGVRRPGVTVAVQLLERKGLIERQRASIVIIDRKALEKLSNGTYAPAVYN
jgi:CRP-like cAMP-binding protein